MSSVIYNVFYIFFVVLEIILFLYIITSWIPMNNRFRDLLVTLLAPVLEPVRVLLRHSIFNTPAADLSPIIGLVVISFLQQFFYSLK
jgi:YGGT family.